MNPNYQATHIFFLGPRDHVWHFRWSMGGKVATAEADEHALANGRGAVFQERRGKLEMGYPLVMTNTGKP